MRIYLYAYQKSPISLIIVFIKRSGRNLSVDFFYTLEKLEYLKWFKGVWVYIPNQKFDSLRISIPRVIKSLEKIKYIDFA